MKNPFEVYTVFLNIKLKLFAKRGYLGRLSSICATQGGYRSARCARVTRIWRASSCLHLPYCARCRKQSCRYYVFSILCLQDEAC